MDGGLTFPGSEQVEMDFRDGKRPVPDYLSSVLAGIDTHRMTYEEALAFAHRKIESDYANDMQSGIVTAHFRSTKWG